MDRKISLISLGCAKNLVNSEQMLYLLSEAGYTLVPEPDGADAVIINTCGFIELGKIIVTGCLAERYQDTVMQELPEIDAVLGVGSFGDIVEAVTKALNNESVFSFGDKTPPLRKRRGSLAPDQAGRICALPRAATISAPSAQFLT